MKTSTRWSGNNFPWWETCIISSLSLQILAKAADYDIQQCVSTRIQALIDYFVDVYSTTNSFAGLIHRLDSNNN